MHALPLVCATTAEREVQELQEEFARRLGHADRTIAALQVGMLFGRMQSEGEMSELCGRCIQGVQACCIIAALQVGMVLSTWGMRRGAGGMRRGAVAFHTRQGRSVPSRRCR